VYSSHIQYSALGFVKQEHAMPILYTLCTIYHSPSVCYRRWLQLSQFHTFFFRSCTSHQPTTDVTTHWLTGYTCPVFPDSQHKQHWHCHKLSRKRLNAFEMWILRSMVQVSWKDNATINKHLLERVKKSTSIMDIILHQNSWLRHVPIAENQKLKTPNKLNTLKYSSSS